MDENLKNEWIIALRSGEFKQGRASLFNPNNNSYCCLGVLCKILGATMYHEDCLDKSVLLKSTGEVLSGGGALLTQSFQRRIGLTDDVCSKLTYKNDFMDSNNIHRYSFDDIANYIEENVETK